MTALGGVWEGWRSPEGEIVHTFAIITVPAGPDIADLHDRMPPVLEERDWPAWLSETKGDSSALLQLSPAGTLRVWPVARTVSSPANNGADLLESV
jgi:putative SOS response-associated peptidase YedK